MTLHSRQHYRRLLAQVLGLIDAMVRAPKTIAVTPPKRLISIPSIFVKRVVYTIFFCVVALSRKGQGSKSNIQYSGGFNSWQSTKRTRKKTSAIRGNKTDLLRKLVDFWHYKTLLYLSRLPLLITSDGARVVLCSVFFVLGDLRERDLILNARAEREISN